MIIILTMMMIMMAMNRFKFEEIKARATTNKIRDNDLLRVRFCVILCFFLINLRFSKQV